VEEKCTECGNVCKGIVHKNMRGEFSGAILCDYCFKKLKFDLEQRWFPLKREHEKLRPPSVTAYALYDPEYSRLHNEWERDLKNISQMLGPINKRYYDLTGIALWK